MKEQRLHVGNIIPIQRIERQIYLVRGLKVMIDSDLAELYQVETKYLNRLVRRNLDRFPEDFMLRLTPEEAEVLRCQIGTSKLGSGGRRYLPYAFTEHGVVMLSSILNSERAVQMNILIIRAFVKLREILSTHKELASRIEKLEANQKKHGSVISILADEIDNLKALPPEPPKDPMGFRVKK